MCAAHFCTANIFDDLFKSDRAKWYWTKWYGQNGSIELKIIFSNYKSQISDKPKWDSVEAGLFTKIILSVGVGLLN